MRDKIAYEWRLNSTDEHGDIQDVCFYEVTVEETMQMLKEFTPKESTHNNIELSVVWWNEENGITDIDYAPMIDKELANEFEHGRKIPEYIKANLVKAIVKLK